MNALWNTFRYGDWPFGNTIRPRYCSNLSSTETRLIDLSPIPRYVFDDTSQAILELCDGRRTVGEIYGELCRRDGGMSQNLLATFTKNVLWLYELGELELEVAETSVLETTKVLDLRDITFYVINCLKHTQKRKFMERQ